MAPERAFESVRGDYERALREIFRERCERAGREVPDVTDDRMLYALEELTLAIEREQRTERADPYAFLNLQGASGSGKGTIGQRIVAAGIPKLARTTDRARRPDEVEGVDYFFVSEDEFTRRLAAGEFAGTPEATYGERRGMDRKVLDAHLRRGQFFIEGCARVPLEFLGYPPTADLPFLNTYLLTPSFDELVNRLQGRSGEERSAAGQATSVNSDDQITKRIRASVEHLTKSRHVEGDRPMTDVFVVNDEVGRATGIILDLLGQPRQEG